MFILRTFGQGAKRRNKPQTKTFASFAILASLRLWRRTAARLYVTLYAAAKLPLKLGRRHQDHGRATVGTGARTGALFELADQLAHLFV